MALVTDLVGFGTLILIPIQMIQELAITASIGVALKILPIWSCCRFWPAISKSMTALSRAAKARETRMRLMQKLGNIANPRAAVGWSLWR